MPYQSVVLRMLISAPGDVPPHDLQIVADAVSRFNFRTGLDMDRPITVLPVMWSQHSYSVFGVRPQEALNEQLVDLADFGLAMFANRLGTPTGVAPSGTVEEIEGLLAAGKHVSVVRNTGVLQPPGRAAAEQRLALEEHLEESQHRGLLFTYNSGLALAGHIENLLAGQARAVVQDDPSDEAERELERLLNDGYVLSQPSKSHIGVWPSTEAEDRPYTDSRGRMRTRRSWFLVLRNGTGRPVKNVTFRYETNSADTDAPFDLRDQDHEAVPYMADGSTARFPIVQVDQSTNQALCVVTWQYAEQPEASLGNPGETYETRDTVRTV